MLIRVHTRTYDEAELEPFAHFENPSNLGYVLSKVFEYYDETGDEEFVINIEVLDEQLEEARNGKLH